MNLYQRANMGQSPEDYGNPSSSAMSDLPPDADPCDPNNDYYDEALCEELMDSGEYQAPEEVAPPPGEQGQGYPSAPPPPSGAPGGGQGGGQGSSDASGPSVPPGGTANQNGGTAPDGSPLAPGQGVNPDGTPATDANGYPTDANGNPVDEQGNPLPQDAGDPCDPNNPAYDPTQCAPQEAAPITFCDNLISMMMGTSPVQWVTHPRLGEIGVGRTIGPPGQQKLPTYTIVSKNIFLQDPASGKLNYIAFADLNNVASEIKNQARYKDEYNQAFRAQCPRYMDLLDLLNAGFPVNQPGFDASKLPIPGWEYQATDDPALDDAMMGATIPLRDSRGFKRVTPTKGKVPTSKSSQGKKRIPLGGPGVKVPSNLKGYFVRSKKARNAARNKAQASATASIVAKANADARKAAIDRKRAGERNPSISRPGYQPTVQTPIRQSRATVPVVRQVTSLRAGTQSVASRRR